MVALHAREADGPGGERERVDPQQAAADVDAACRRRGRSAGRRRRSCSMSKKLPLKRKENGIVGKPAEPTVAPGGSVAAAACVAGGRRVRRRRRRGRRRRGSTTPPSGRPTDAPAAAAGRSVAAAVSAGVGPWPPAAASFSERKSMRAGARRALQLVDQRGSASSWARPCRASRWPRSPRRSALGLRAAAPPAAARRSAAAAPGICVCRPAASLRLGARPRNQKPARPAATQHGDDDEAVASGHGVVVADAVWAPARRRDGGAKKRVIENCG